MRNQYFLPLKRTLSLKLVVAATASFLCWGSGRLMAQEEKPAPPSLPRPGFQVRTISGYLGYYSSTIPNGSGVQPGTPAAPGDFAGGGSALFTWTRFTERSGFSLDYTPSYTGRFQYSSANSLNHALALHITRNLAPRWKFELSAAGNLSTIEQYLFTPNTLSNVVSVRSTFDDLATALASRTTANTQLANIVNGAPLIESPVTNLLYGQRMFASSARVSLAYSYSPRLSVSFNGGAGRTQHLSDDRTLTANPFLLSDTTSVGANLIVSYSLSPVTKVSGNVTTDRISSTVQDVYTTTSLVGWDRTFRRRWLMNLHGGVGVTNPVHQTTFVLSSQPRPAIGGSLGFKTFSQTFLGSYDRIVSDSYGVGASSSSSVTGAWRLARPGDSWWLESSLRWEQLQGTTATALSGWHASAGFGRHIGSHLAVLMQYAYLYYNYRGQSLKGNDNLSQNGVRISFVWYPIPDSTK